MLFYLKKNLGIIIFHIWFEVVYIFIYDLKLYIFSYLYDLKLYIFSYLYDLKLYIFSYRYCWKYIFSSMIWSCIYFHTWFEIVCIYSWMIWKLNIFSWLIWNCRNILIENWFWNIYILIFRNELNNELNFY